MIVAAVFYGLTTFEGSFMAIRSVNSLSHYTDWTIGHVHADALGWVAMITFRSIYAVVPWLWKARDDVFLLLIPVAPRSDATLRLLPSRRCGRQGTPR